MATVLAKGEVEGRGFIVKGGGEKKKFIIEDSDEMSPRELEEIKLAAWSMSLRCGQSNSSGLSEEKPAGGSQYRSGRLGLRRIPGHRYPGRREGARRLERSDNSDPTAALLGGKALQPVLSGRPINSEWLDFNSLSRYIDRPPEAEEVKLTDWGLSVTRYTDGRSVMSISRPKRRRQIGDRSPKLSSNALLLMPELMQENSGPMLIENLCQAFTERFVNASDEEKERLQGTIEVVVRDAITNLRAKLIEAGLLKKLETTFVYDLETGKRYKAYRLLGVLSSDNRDSANNQDNLLVN